MLQHGLVTLAAFGAAAFVFRRVFTTFKPTTMSPRCGSCQTGGTTGERVRTTGLIQIMTPGPERERPRPAIRRSTHART